MKPFNIFIALIFVVIVSGFIFFKDNLISGPNSSSQNSQQLLADRINYLDYSSSNQALSQKKGKTVLFFAATTWCSNCIALEKEIKNRLSEIPKDVIILKVDYDNDKKTKTKYAVTMQTTLVLLDSNGREIKRWIGTDFDDLLNNLN